jgi:GT2 family glycosyltransferase
MLASQLISVIIVSWNSGAYLYHCLSALSKQTLRGFEVILIDNHSTDGSMDGLERQWSDLRLIVKRLDSNLGFAPANNIGARLARGKWLALLNSDAFPEPDWLENLLRAAEGNPQYNFFASRQVQYHRPDLLDGAGDEYHVSGLAWRRYYNYSEREYGHNQDEVFGACAAAAMYRREDFLDAGGFDEDYFSYFEDVDLSFRLRLAGGRCLYVPDAVVRHVGSASTGKAGDFSFYHGHRNLVWTFFKDMPGPLFWLYLPLHMAVNFYFSFAFLLREGKSAVLKSKLDAFRMLPLALRKRRRVQQSRTVSMLEIHRIMTRDIFAPRKIVPRPPKKERP